ncbi:MAG TPA: sugar phosphate isomerase/epimerase [Bryobacteraceae bacterium]|nr:sugar phosphate isomerase/epimerase [Bryobacteraceae bacterium]
MEIKVLETAAGIGATECLSSPRPELSTNPLGLPIGCQTYPVRALIEKDFEGTLRVLVDAGFQEIELCSPVGYADCGFSGLAKYSGTDLEKIFGAIGVICNSSHFSIQELRDDLAGRIAWAEELGLTQIIVPTLAGPGDPTMDYVRRVADEFNKMGEHTAKAGIQLGLHNEDFELTTVDGRRTYDILFELLDANLVKFQFQVSTISRGYDAAEYFTKYPGRFFSMHLQDWSATAKTTVAAGQGDLDWKNIFSAARVGGIKNYFVELNLDAMKASVPYLRALQV